MKRFSIITGLFALLWPLSAMAEYGPDRDEYARRCARNLIPDCRYELKFASRASVSTTEVPLWGDGATYTFLDAPETIVLTSADADDTVAGSGAQVVRVVCQNEGEWVFENVPMNGLSDATMINQCDFIHRMTVVQAGAGVGDVNAAIGGSLGTQGIITATASGSSVILADIQPGKNVTTQGILRVPAGESWQLIVGVLTGGITKQIDFHIYVKIPGTDIFVLGVEGGVVESPLTFPAKRQYPAGTDLIVTANANTGSTSVAIAIQILRHKAAGWVGPWVELQ